jgi:hypothetical protein
MGPREAFGARFGPQVRRSAAHIDAAHTTSDDDEPSINPENPRSNFGVQHAATRFRQRESGKEKHGVSRDRKDRDDINAVNLEYRLGDVETDCRDRLHGQFL